MSEEEQMDQMLGIKNLLTNSYVQDSRLELVIIRLKLSKYCNELL